jgi:cardiolipin synthase
MDNVAFGAHSIHVLLKVLRAVRIAPLAAIEPADLRGNAHGLSYAILASMWLRRTGAPSWKAVYEAWERQSSPGDEPDPSLYGQLHPDDRFELLTNNRAAFVEREHLLKNARYSVDIATYYIQADETGWKTAHQLAECAARGVRVRIIADHVVTASKTFQNPRMRELSRFLQQSGIDCRLFANPARPYDANHRKLLIVDGDTLVTGGRNYADHYSGDDWRDIELLLIGPSVRALLPLYEETFTTPQVGPVTPVNVPTLFQPTAPEEITRNAAFLFLLQCTNAAQRTLDIENAYYINHPVLHSRLAAACARGVRVRLFTNSAESNDLDFTNYRIYSGFPDLLKAGVQIYLRGGRGCTLHCKYFVADEEWTGFGSSNLDFYSPRFCREAGVHVRNRELATKLTAWFESGINQAQRLLDPAVAFTVIEGQTIGKIFDRHFTDFQ